MKAQERELRVLLQSRRDLFSVPGGDTVIVENTRAALARRHVEAVVACAEDAPDLSDFDLVHLFNVAHRDCYAHAHHARRQGKPIVVSTIYWNQDELLREGSAERSDYVEPRHHRRRRQRWRLAERLGLMSGASARRRQEKARYYALGSHGMARDLAQMADVLLPSSATEHALVLRDLGVGADKPVELAAYGVDPVFSAPPPARNAFFERHRLRDFVLCVGRVERRKNQKGLLDAVRGLGLPVVLVGAGTDAAYAAEVRARLSPRDLWVEHVPSERMHEVYALARIHVLASFNEVPGLASLEAGAAGLPVVASRRGSARDYLGDRADYCDPGDPVDIRRACEAALARSRPALDLARHVRRSFTWDRNVERVLAAYRRIGSESVPRRGGREPSRYTGRACR